MSRFSPVLPTGPSNARTLATIGTSDSAPKERQDLAQRSRPMRSHVSEPLRSAKCLTAGWRSVAHDRLLLDIAIGMFFLPANCGPVLKDHADRRLVVIEILVRFLSTRVNCLLL
jgi:hypothetical protein